MNTRPEQQQKMFVHMKTAHFVPYEMFEHLQRVSAEKNITIDDLYAQIMENAIQTHMADYARSQAERVRTMAALDATRRPGPKPKAKAAKAPAKPVGKKPKPATRPTAKRAVPVKKVAKGAAKAAPKVTAKKKR